MNGAGLVLITMFILDSGAQNFPTNDFQFLDLTDFFFLDSTIFDFLG